MRFVTPFNPVCGVCPEAVVFLKWAYKKVVYIFSEAVRRGGKRVRTKRENLREGQKRPNARRRRPCIGRW